MGGVFESEEEFNGYFLPVDTDQVSFNSLMGKQDGYVTFEDFRSFMLN